MNKHTIDAVVAAATAAHLGDPTCAACRASALEVLIAGLSATTGDRIYRRMAPVIQALREAMPSPEDIALAHMTTEQEAET